MGATLMVSRQRKDKEPGIACRRVFRTPPRASLDCGGPIVTPGSGQIPRIGVEAGISRPGAVAMVRSTEPPDGPDQRSPMRDRRVDGLVGYTHPLAMLI